MANEIKTSFSLNVENGNFKPGSFSHSININQAAIGGLASVQTINTSATEALTTGDISTLGTIYLRNTDSTNFVTFGTSIGQIFKLKAGEWAWARIKPGSTVYAQADTAAVKLYYQIYED